MMKKTFFAIPALAIVLLLMPLYAYASADEKTVEDPAKTSEVFTAVEQSAEFPGGTTGLLNWLSQNIKYPAEAQAAREEGRVIVRFVVSKTGEVKNPEIIRGVSESLNKEALRIISSMPKWMPAKNNGEAVDSYFTMPVTFRL